MGSLLRSNLVVATGTTLSRITGLLRVMVFGYVIGQTALADAYRIGNETPNIIYELVVGGVLSATLVPMFTAFHDDDDDVSAEVVMTVTLLALTVLTVVAVIAAPWIFRLYTLDPGAGVDPDAFRKVGTMLTRFFLLQILFYGITALATAMLQARRRFFAAAWSPVLSNVVVIISLVALPSTPALGDVLTSSRIRLTLGLGATLGIAVMAVAMIVAVVRSGASILPRLDWRHPAVKRLIMLSGWTLGYVVANQVTVAVVRNLADPGSGDASAYFDAFTFFVLPHGLLAMSIATTFVPEMSRSVARRDKSSFIDQASLGIRLVALLTIPAGFGIFVLRRSIVGLLLEHGEYTSAAADNTARALGGFALGLVGFSIYLFMLRTFYSHQDTRTPFVVNVVQNVLNIVLAFVFVHFYGVLGLGLALAVSYLVCAVWTLQVLSFKVPGFPVGDTLVRIGRMAFAGLLSAEAIWFATRAIGTNTGSTAAARIVIGAVVGIAVYVGVLAAVGSPELESVRRRLPTRITDHIPAWRRRAVR